MFDVILDRDGILNIDVGYTHRLEDFKLVPGVVNALTILKKKGARFSIATGQSGIARGLYTIEQMEVFNKKLVEEFKKEGIEFAAVVFCPHHPSVSDCDCRKPKTGMLGQIEKKIGKINWNSAWGIGDKPSDAEMILSKGGKSVLVASQYWEANDPALKNLLSNPKNFVAKTLPEAAEIID